MPQSHTAPNNGMHPTPHQRASPVRCAGARGMPGGRRRRFDLHVTTSREGGIMIMTVRAVLVAAVLVSCGVAAFGQDPLKVAPEAYRLQFENEWVKVTRVHYGPRARVPLHEHTRWPAAYVYLNDAGPVIFRHADWEHPVLMRPATKAGSFRLSPTTAVNEPHEVENPSNTASDFLRVEFKTRPVNRNSLRGRFYRGRYRPGRNFRKVEFEHEQIRVTRLACAPRRSLALATTASEAALLICLFPARLK